MLDLEAVIDELVAIGPRYTASPAHRRFESLLADGFRAAGAEVFTDDYLVPSWDPDDVQLEIEASEGRYRPVTVASVYPHSGTTDPAGVIGRLIDLGALSSVDLRNADLRGCVALITYPPLREPLPYPSIWGLAHGDDEPAPREWGMGSQHWLAIEKLRQQLLGMGAVGLIVGWQELGPGPAAGQYQPILPPSVRKLYGRPTRSLPHFEMRVMAAYPRFGLTGQSARSCRQRPGPHSVSGSSSPPHPRCPGPHQRSSLNSRAVPMTRSSWSRILMAST